MTKEMTDKEYDDWARQYHLELDAKRFREQEERERQRAKDRPFNAGAAATALSLVVLSTCAVMNAPWAGGMMLAAVAAGVGYAIGWSNT